MNKNPRRAVAFIALTYAITGLLSYAFFALVELRGQSALMALGLPYMFMPTIAAATLQKIVYREPVLEPLRVSARWNRWFLVAWMAPPLIGIAALGVSLLFPAISFSRDMEDMFQRYAQFMSPEQIAQARAQVTSMPVHPFWIGLLFGMIAGATINAAASLGEELGWRGFLLRQLEGYGFWPASLVIGLVWGLWHAPLVLHGLNYPQHPVAGVAMMTLSCMLLSPPMVYITLRARSVLAAALFHGTFNGTAGLAVLVVAGGDDLISGVTGLPGFIVLAGVNLLLLIYERIYPALTPEDA